MADQELLPNLFRTEYSKLVAVLCSIFGLSNIQIAEDIVGDTFLLATETWGKKGLPDNQVAWLYGVAKNKTKDYLKREKIRSEKVEPEWKRQQSSNYELEIDLSEQNITDSQLQMIFAVCHPQLSTESQISLALRVLCGFGNDEIASALLTNKEVINKRLYRAKKSLKKHQVEFSMPAEKETQERLDTVLTTLYLLFNEGYYSAGNNVLIKRDLCLEAMRLTLLLLNNPSTNLPRVNALLSLMCFQSSRFNARLTGTGEFILYEDQNRELWDLELIKKGEYYLNQSSTGHQLSKYHLEAAIAFWHAQQGDVEKWENILQLYNYLLQIEYSPITALNRTYALAKANGKEEAIQEALKIKLENHHLYHSLLAELYKGLDANQELKHLKLALDLAKQEGEKAMIEKKIEAYLNRTI